MVIVGDFQKVKRGYTELSMQYSSVVHIPVQRQILLCKVNVGAAD